jgi:HEAT repeat protein
MTATFIAMLARRWLSERRIRREGAALIGATKYFLGRIENPDPLFPDVRYRKATRMQAVLNLSRLLRGSERVKLMTIADDDGMFDSALQELKHRKPRRRTHAIELLDQFESRKSVMALRSVMANDPIYELRLGAAFTLARFGHLPSPRDTISQMSLLTNENSRIHLALFRALAPIYTEQLKDLVNNPEYLAIKPSVIDALGWSDNPSCLAEIANASSDIDPDIRCAALRAAGQLGYPQAGQWILPMLEDSDESVRIQAIRCAARLSLAQAIPRIEALANDSSAWVRWRADEALSALKPSRPALRE